MSAECTVVFMPVEKCGKRAVPISAPVEAEWTMTWGLLMECSSMV